MVGEWKKMLRCGSLKFKCFVISAICFYNFITISFGCPKNEFLKEMSCVNFLRIKGKYNYQFVSILQKGLNIMLDIAIILQRLVVFRSKKYLHGNTYLQYTFSVLLAILKHFYLNHCLLNFSMIMKDFRCLHWGLLC